MANNSKEWLGQKFGRLTVTDFEHAKPPYRGWMWVCRCDCGEMRTLVVSDVKSGKTRSCGCLHDEACTERAIKFRHRVGDHKRLYSIYNGIKKRCYATREPRYKDYGARGIRMCDEWLNPVNGFDNFAEWSFSHNYNDDMTIDRINVDGNYEPENCRWIPLREQALNKRDTLRVTYQGQTIPLRELCDKRGVNYDTVHNRIYSLKWSVEKAIETPSQQDGSLRSKCEEMGISYSTVRDRIFKLGWSEERALNTPSLGRGANKKSYE